MIDGSIIKNAFFSSSELISDLSKVDLEVSRFKSTRVDLRIPSRVESILLTSTTGFVDLSRFCFKST